MYYRSFAPPVADSRFLWGFPLLGGFLGGLIGGGIGGGIGSYLAARPRPFIPILTLMAMELPTAMEHRIGRCNKEPVGLTRMGFLFEVGRGGEYIDG